MTRKEYQMIADVIREIDCDPQSHLVLRLFVSRLISEFTKANPRFQSNWFLAECGM